jgi:hypothetical protein
VVPSVPPLLFPSLPLPASTNTLLLPELPQETTALPLVHAMPSMHTHLPTLRTGIAVVLLVRLAKVARPQIVTIMEGGATSSNALGEEIQTPAGLDQR